MGGEEIEGWVFIKVLLFVQALQVAGQVEVAEGVEELSLVISGLGVGGGLEGVGGGLEGVEERQKREHLS